MLTRLNYLKEINFNFEGQHGYLPGRSTITALNDIVDFIAENLDCGRTVINTFLDLSKAFNVLDHDLILSNFKIRRPFECGAWLVFQLSARLRSTTN